MGYAELCGLYHDLTNKTFKIRGELSFEDFYTALSNVPPADWRECGYEIAFTYILVSRNLSVIPSAPPSVHVGIVPFLCLLMVAEMEEISLDLKNSLRLMFN
jgi:hypothetical protein